MAKTIRATKIFYPPKLIMIERREEKNHNLCREEWSWPSWPFPRWGCGRRRWCPAPRRTSPPSPSRPGTRGRRKRFRPNSEVKNELTKLFTVTCVNEFFHRLQIPKVGWMTAKELNKNREFSSTGAELINSSFESTSGCLSTIIYKPWWRPPGRTLKGALSPGWQWSMRSLIT